MVTIITPNLGFGNASFGGSDYGYGDPAIAAGILNQPLQNGLQNGSLDARLIDTNTRDFVINDDGNTAGMTSISQQVFLALSTTLGTSATLSVGNTSKQMRTITPNYQAQLIGIVQTALQSLVQAGSISIVNITVTKLTFQGTVTGATVNVFWMDNTLNTMQQSNLNVSGQGT